MGAIAKQIALLVVAGIIAQLIGTALVNKVRPVRDIVGPY